MPAATQEKPIIDEKELELQVSFPWTFYWDVKLFFLYITRLWWELLSFKKLFLSSGTFSCFVPIGEIGLVHRTLVIWCIQSTAQ